ncbi:unnamed protein product [Lactuca virosa]|uniref:Uncharacterized protein n=1 Tax=Lactuca virosa TaxID=75947 RepID=A0AAU9M4S7_9ASTR|nr:unnamed protein product [Lactuca virosa]
MKQKIFMHLSNGETISFWKCLLLGEVTLRKFSLNMIYMGAIIFGDLGFESDTLQGEKVMKQSLMELAMQEQVRERQEMEKKMQKLIKTMDHFKRAKREEAAPLIEATFQRCLAEEKLRHEHEQQLEVELSRERQKEI